jgi:quinol-cytochrome oxidoreductase complex cytochrome b subunit/mono/diheme cytochrome c family protein
MVSIAASGKVVCTLCRLQLWEQLFPTGCYTISYVYNCIIMARYSALITVIVLIFGGLVFASLSVQASPSQITPATPTFDITRLAQPPTVYPPDQADNGAQIYWGMCSACHGDRGQGLTAEWRDLYAPNERDCWQSGCHGSDFPINSFGIPQTGVPPLAGQGKLARFSNAFELQSFIHGNMPFFPAGSLTSEEALTLAAYVLQINGMQPEGLALNRENSAAIPIHRKVDIPESENPGTLIMAGILVLVAVGLGIQARRKIAGATSLAARPNFFHHLHPPSIPAEQARFRFTLGAGGLAVFLMLILFITGLLEMYYYIPTPEQAAVSVETITTLVPFGSLIRNLHFWSAQLLVIVITVHLLRVALTGAYAPPRRFNYLLGLGLLVLVLLLDFTGYMLRWDEGIRWALVVGTNLLKTIPWIGEGLYQFVIGGSEPGAATVIRFYAWHIFGLSLAASILLIWHIFRVRRDGGIAVPPSTQRQEKSRITRFELLRREVLAMIVVSVVLLLLSLLIPAPIDQPIAGTNALTGDSRAPWFFLWIQQLLKLGNPFLWGVLIPVLVVVVLGLFPYLLPNAKKNELGRWFTAGNRTAQVLTVLIILTILLLTIWGVLSTG